MTKLTARGEFVMKNYELGMDTIDGGIAHSCRVCAAQVVDSGDALERHVKWHESLVSFKSITEIGIAGHASVDEYLRTVDEYLRTRKLAV